MGFDFKRVGLAIGSGGLSELSRKNGSSPSIPGYSGPKFGIAKTEDFIKDDKVPQGLDQGGAISKRFGQKREQIQQQTNTGQEQAIDAIKRRFAGMGGGGGAQIKLEQQALDRGEQAKRESLKDLGMQEEEAMSQNARSNADLDFRQKAFNFEKGSKLHELNLAERQQQISQAESEYNARMNQFLNKPPKQGFISNILGNIL